MVKPKHLLLIICTVFPFLTNGTQANAQGLNAELKELTTFLTRMYKSEPFEGVRVVTDYDNTYLLSVLSLDKSKYSSQSAINRVASVKAMSEASRFFNGSSITSDLIIRTVEKKDGEVENEIIENISERSSGYVKELQQLTNFPDKDGRQVFIFYKQLEQPSKPEERKE